MILKLSEHGHSVTRGCVFLSQLKIAAFLWWARARRSVSASKQLVRCRFAFTGVGDGNTEKQSSSRSADPSSLSPLCCVKCRAQWWGSLLKILSVVGWSSKCRFSFIYVGNCCRATLWNFVLLASCCTSQSNENHENEKIWANVYWWVQWEPWKWRIWANVYCWVPWEPSSWRIWAGTNPYTRNLFPRLPKVVLLRQMPTNLEIPWEALAEGRKGSTSQPELISAPGAVLLHPEESQKSPQSMTLKKGSPKDVSPKKCGAEHFSAPALSALCSPELWGSRKEATEWVS